MRWPIGHCKCGWRPFELVFIDFITMPNSKGKRYILTILDSFSEHFTAIPCARDRAIDTARGLYQFFLRHREMPRILPVKSTNNSVPKCPYHRNFTAPSGHKALETPSGNITWWRMPSTCYVRIGTVNGLTYLNPSLHPWMPWSTALLV